MSRRPSFVISECGGIEEHVLAAKLAEEAGVQRIWLAENRGPDAIVTGAAIAATTSLEIGISIAPTATRTPAVLAMAAADLSRLSGRTVHFGLGAGGKAIIEQWHGQEFTRAVERLTDVIAIVRQALAGERTDYQGEVLFSRGFKLASLPTAPVLLYVGAMGELMTRAAGELSDGLITSWVTVEGVRERAAALEAATGNRSIDEPARLVAMAYVSVADDPEPAREGVRREMVEYLLSPPYARYFRSIGFDADADAVAEAFQRRDRAASVAAVSDELLDAILIVGSVERCAETIDAMYAAGATDVMVRPVPAQFGGDPDDTIARLSSHYVARGGAA